MRKNAKALALALVVAALACGCGNKEVVEETPVEEYATYTPPEETGDSSGSGLPGPEADWDGVTEELLAAVPELESLTRDDLFFMSLPEFKAFMKTYVPNFREVYKINHDYISPSDWSQMRYFVSYQLFGTMNSPEGYVRFADEDEQKAQRTEELQEIFEEPADEAQPEPSEEEPGSPSLAENLHGNMNFDEFTDEDLESFMEEIGSLSTEGFADALADAFPEEAESVYGLTNEELEQIRTLLVEICYSEYHARQQQNSTSKQ